MASSWRSCCPGAVRLQRAAESGLARCLADERIAEAEIAALRQVLQSVERSGGPLLVLLDASVGCVATLNLHLRIELRTELREPDARWRWFGAHGLSAALVRRDAELAPFIAARCGIPTVRPFVAGLRLVGDQAVFESMSKWT